MKRATQSAMMKAWWRRRSAAPPGAQSRARRARTPERNGDRQPSPQRAPKAARWHGSSGVEGSLRLTARGAGARSVAAPSRSSVRRGRTLVPPASAWAFVVGLPKKTRPPPARGDPAAGPRRSAAGLRSDRGRQPEGRATRRAPIGLRRRRVRARGSAAQVPAWQSMRSECAGPISRVYTGVSSSRTRQWRHSAEMWCYLTAILTASTIGIGGTSVMIGGHPSSTVN